MWLSYAALEGSPPKLLGYEDALAELDDDDRRMVLAQLVEEEGIEVGWVGLVWSGVGWGLVGWAGLGWGVLGWSGGAWGPRWGRGGCELGGSLS